MSEFKVGDWVKMKDDSSAWMGKVAAIEYKPCFDSKWNRYEIEILVFEDGTKLGSGWAIHVDQAAGHRIDKPSNSRELETIDEPVGSLQELHPEFAKVLHENFLELLGDDDHIENHISPLCKSKDVEKDKPMTFNEWLGTRGDMVLLHANCCRIAYEGGQQSMQAKVEELEKKLQSAKESAYKAGFYDGRNGTPCEYTRLEAERNELQTLYTQQGINMFKLQKRVDAALAVLTEYYTGSYDESPDLVVDLEQALKGEG